MLPRMIPRAGRHAAYDKSDTGALLRSDPDEVGRVGLPPHRVKLSAVRGEIEDDRAHDDNTDEI
jgi:hypothetical protein